MLFSSFSFLFAFLPAVLLFYFVVKNRKYRNFILLIFSLFFYAWGEPKYIILMIASIGINYFIGLLIDKYQSKKWLVSGIIINLLLIGIFKYLDFGILTFNSIFKVSLPMANIALPIGISFYTFQIMSYIIDVYRKKVEVQKNILNLGTYIALFPQLIAGPIVRYETIENELTDRNETIDKFVTGFRRFVVGLSKKVIIANGVALVADSIYNSPNLGEMGSLALWLGAIAYTLQIYFDFSGYSDMAIGLGKMFGFEFLENFNYPYIATSVTDFWRRWHISLSSWFKDYLYIPLGGNRCSKIKWIRNALIVWAATGLWHGASWNFVLWGLYFAFFLILEKLFLQKLLKKCPKWFSWTMTMFIVVVSWVIFRMENFNDLKVVLVNMFNFSGSNLKSILWQNYDIMINLPIVLLGISGSFPFIKKAATAISKKHWFFEGMGYVISLALFGISIAMLLTNTYNPFIYFRF